LALEELEELIERLNGLQEKLEILSNERSELLLRIETVSTMRQEAFMQAFTEVDSHFRENFANLSDGDGFLQLENSNSPLEGGLTLVAHPKGKNVRRLASMSGGEKSLTALSFLFALQKYKPSPFYALDEVDSFLDGINVERLSKLISNQSSNAQFIVVSHRRPMISASERTIGVAQARGANTQVLGLPNAALTHYFKFIRQNDKKKFKILSNTSANKNLPNSVPSERLWLRAELMGTQVITTDTGRRLGVVGEVVVDIDRREVVALGLIDNPLTRFLPGLPKWMPLESIKQVGDVILVDSLDSLSESFSPERYGKVINCQVITESGLLLGRVLGFSFDIESGDLISLVMGSVGVPLLGEGVLSTWEIPVEEIVSSGTDRIIVYEGAEEKLKQLSSGLLEKLGVGGSSWDEREANGYSANLVPVENQLLSGSESEKENNLVEEYEEEVV